MKLPIPPSPFKKLRIHGESLTVDTSGKVLVLPTGNADVLPLFNEYVLSPTRLTDDFGGLTGAGSPDYLPGTLYTPTDEIIFTDVAGNNSTKTLTAGKLKQLEYLTVDTAAHTITEEFIVVNTATSNNPTTLFAMSSTSGWSVASGYGTGSLSIENGKMKVSGTTNADGVLYLSNASFQNYSTLPFISFIVNSSIAGTLSLELYDGNEHYKDWTGGRFSVPSDLDTAFVLPVWSPQGLSGSNPDTVTLEFNPVSAKINLIGIITSSGNTAITLYISPIFADTYKSAYIELQTPDFLADSSLTIQAHNGTAYQTTGTYKLDSAYATVGTPTSANWTLNDGTKLDDVYGTGLGRALFPKNVSGATSTGSTGTMVYSGNQGTKNRIGLMVSLPPSDGGRTNFNKIRLKTVLYYSYTNNSTDTLPDLSGYGNDGAMSMVGLATDNLGNPYGAMSFDGVRSYARVPHNSLLNVGLNDFTISFWFYTNSLVTREVINKFTPGTPSSGFRVIFETPILQFKAKYNGVSYLISAVSQNLSEHTWYHAVLVADRDVSIKWHIDGSTSGTPDITDISSDISSSTALYFGTPGWSLDSFFGGKLKDVRIYNRALSQAEVTALYNNLPVSSTGLVAQWQPAQVQNMGSTSYDFADSTNASYGLQNLTKPWLALYDPASTEIDFYLFTHRPKNLEFKRDESGTIHELVLYPGNGNVYHGRITHCNPTLDSDSNLIPDCLEASIEGSITKFLQSYGMVI